MKFVRAEKKDIYLHDTIVENFFISEYLPVAPGDFVKVYLYGSMCAQYGLSVDEKMFSSQIGLSPAVVNEAWNYWEELGAVRKKYYEQDGKVDFDINFVDLKSLVYGNDEGEDEILVIDDAVLENQDLRSLISEIESTFNRPLSSGELTDISGWAVDDKYSPEIILRAVKYSVQKGKDSTNYIAAVLKNWRKDGLLTIEDVEKYIEAHDQKNFQYKRILQSLGFKRNATEAECRMMDSWLNDMGYSMERILEACAKTTGIANPNFNYVNAILHKWKEGAESKGVDVNKSNMVSQATLNRYYEYLREKAQREAEERTQEIYQKLPFIKELDEEVQKVGSEITITMLKGRYSGDVQKQKEEMDALADERAAMLEEAGFEADYTDIKYLCDKCSDTGITDIGERCSCVEKRMEEASVWERGENNEH